MPVESKEDIVEVAAVADDGQVQSSHCSDRHLRIESKEKGVLPNTHSQCFVIISLVALEDWVSLCKFKANMCHSFASVCRNYICLCCSYTADPCMRD